MPPGTEAGRSGGARRTSDSRGFYLFRDPGRERTYAFQEHFNDLTASPGARSSQWLFVESEFRVFPVAEQRDIRPAF
jgi:hypothetical protein